MTATGAEYSYPLSPLQEGMLFHDLYDQQPGVYIQQWVCHLQENLNVAVFKSAWQQVVKRYPILRTSFHWEGLDEPRQEVHRHVALLWEEQDWRGLSGEEQATHLEVYLRTDRRRGFALTEAPLLRLALFRVAEAGYQFIWTFHHALLDGRAQNIVLKEVFAFYEAFCQGRDLQLPRSRPYRDHIAWLERQDWARAEAFWRQTLAGFSAPTPLVGAQPLDEGLGLEEGHGEQRTTLSVAATSALRSLAQRHDLTINTLLQGAWALLLSRYSGEEDVVFGAVRACRRSAVEGAESIVGLFINTLPVRARLAPDMSLLAWLRELRAQWLAMREHEHTPLVEVQNWSEVPRDLPLFESILVFAKLEPAPRAQDGSWENRKFYLLERPNYPLVLHGYLDGPDEVLLLKIGYDRRRFDDATAGRMLRHVQTLLEGMAANPEQRLANVPLLTPSEGHQLLAEWNDTKTDYPRGVCVHELFEEQAQRTPEALAVAFEDRQLSYRELNERANRLAHYLRKLGVGPEVLVGICVERSVEMVVGLLGILKAGGAYLPLDPAYPKKRLAFMLEDAQVPVLLTRERLLGRLPEHEAKTVRLDKDWEEIAREGSERNPQSGSTSENLAYVTYTSGSTGVPKGVMVEHRPVARLVKNTNYLQFHPDEVFLQLAPLSFDASTLEIWGPLLNGGRLALAPPGRLSLAELAATIRRYEVTTLWLTAGLFHQLVDAEPAALSGVRNLLAGGDVLSASHVRQALHRLPKVCLINGYGPTENTTFTCCFVMSAASPPPEGSIPIGRPISNTRVYILDARLHPVPIGVVGELYAGGDGLARGYLNRPELTAEKFIPDPFSDEPGGRLYRTGDLARYLPDGNIEFVGRVDDQIKVRGFRVEMGEVEAVLTKHPTVRQSVMVAQEDEPGEKRLVAYVVVPTAQQQEPTTSELHGYLKERLPEYMVPSAFVVLEALPLTPNGKVDRRALPAPDPSSLRVENAYEAPRTPLEEALAGIWEEVLGLEWVGIHDDFFELGGHSLLATRVVSRLCHTFQVELSLSSLFEEPTVVQLAERIEAARRAAQGLPAPPPLLPVSRGRRLPLSFAQQRLWFLDQLEPNSSLYNIPRAVRLAGRLNVTALERSLDEIVRRHEALRTIFAYADGSPVQVIAPAPVTTAALPLVDLSELPKSEREAQTQRLATEEAQCPFDLSQGPLMRAKLLRLDDEEHVLLLTMHHIVSDGWSMEVFWRELAALYDAFANGQPSPLPELPVQYVDYAIWQRRWLAGEVLDEQLSYWKRQLADLPALQLPTDRPRPAVQTHRGARQELVLPKLLTEALKELSRREGVTLFMTLLAAFQVLLSRYSGQEDIAVGSPIAGRNRAEIEGLIGFFANTLVVRTDLSGDPTFKELLRRVREVALEAYDHQDVPFEKLVEELQPQRDTSRTPLFQVMLTLQNTPGKALELPGLRLTQQELERGTAKFDLTLSMVEGPEGLRGACEYNTDLFEAATITRMLGHLQTLLEGVVANPAQRLSTLPLLTEAERHQLLIEWNDTQIDYPREACIHRLFEEQAERTPDAVAVVFDDQQLTYRELNRRANQLAHHLRRLGVGPEVLVGICVERSPELVVGVLAILKAGGAYVPLDPAYPKERLAFMLEDAQVPVLLTQERLIEGLPRHAARLVCLDADWPVVAREPEKNPTGGATARNVAYAIYTSGSTGRPKGVLLTHGGLSNLVSWHRQAFAVSEVDRAAQVAGPAFDASVWELWPYLAAGASVYFPDEETRLSPMRLRDWLLSESITISFLPTPLAESALSLDWPDNSVLRIMLTGGEKLYRYPSDSTPFTVVNNYGPTENTVVTTSGLVPPTKAGKQADTTPTIGRPIANTQTYLLDRNLEPVPMGVPGELHIGGAGLARGYLNRPELTAEKFVPNPFGDEPGARLYKTGDLARYLPDGSIEFLGRLDYQVKVRGFRVEPGEVETVLTEHPVVRQSVVVAREDEPGDKRLVAYVVPTQRQAPTSGELRALLKAKLPEYMVPSVFVLLEVLPLTPSGKVDRHALPAPEPSRPALEKAYAAPRTPVQEALVSLWVEVLGLGQVGIHDDFFELGGHSLLATRLVSRLCHTFQVELSLSSFFEGPTIAMLAERIEATQRAARSLPTPPPLRLVSRDAQLPLSFAQQRLWFLNQLEPNSPLYNVPRALRLSGVLDAGALQQALRAIVARHEVLRTTFAVVDGEPVQVVAPTPSVPLPIEDLSSLPQSERQAQAWRRTREEGLRRFDLAQGPLLRAKLLRLSEEEHVLLIGMHHIVSDAWSMDVFWRELGALYEAFSSGKPSPLAELPIQYADYAVWQREWLTGEVLERHLGYWKRQLADIAALQLPTDRPRPAAQTHRGALQWLRLPESLSEALRELSRREGMTLFMVLLAAFQALLSRYAGQEDIAVGTPIAGRNQAEIEGLIGFFLNMLVMRTDLSGDPTFRELLRRVREVTLGAYDHQDVPFEKLVEKLKPGREMNRTPLVQVFLNMHQVGNSTLELDGLTIETVPGPEQHGELGSVFDLTLYVWEREEGIALSAEYDAELFEADTITRMLGHLQTLLEGVVANPEQRLSTLPLRTEGERHRLLVEWNDTKTDYPKDRCVHELFEEGYC